MNIEEYGLNAIRLVAGFSGGVAHVFISRQAEAFAAIGSIVTGTLTANYLGPAASHYLSAWIGDGGTSFIVGLGAMAVCQGVLSIIQSKMKWWSEK